MKNRIDIIQDVILKRSAQAYLEIGVNRGYCFFNIKCRNKVAVDPSFEIPSWRKILYCIKNRSNLKNKFFELSSDEFFSLNKEKFDVIFIDGLHTHEQSYKDIINAREILNNNGVILVHDCNPITEASAQDVSSIKKAKLHKDYKGDWSGAVWKSIVKYRLMHPTHETHVIDTDHGIGVIIPDLPSNNTLSNDIKLDQLKYTDLEKNRKQLLNLISITQYRSWLK